MDKATFVRPSLMGIDGMRHDVSDARAHQIRRIYGAKKANELLYVKDLADEKNANLPGIKLSKERLAQLRANFGAAGANALLDKNGNLQRRFQFGENGMTGAALAAQAAREAIAKAGGTPSDSLSRAARAATFGKIK